MNWWLSLHVPWESSSSNAGSQKICPGLFSCATIPQYCDVILKKQLTTYRFSEQTGVTIQTRVAMCQLQKRGQTAKHNQNAF